MYSENCVRAGIIAVNPVFEGQVSRTPSVVVSLSMGRLGVGGWGGNFISCNQRRY